MKFFIVILTVVAFACAEYTDEEKELWLSFKLEHGKLFLSSGKEKERMDTFLNNVKEVEAHNEAFENGEASYEKTLNKYSDLTDEAFLARFGGVKMPAEARTVDPSKVVTLRGTPPATLNLLDKMGASWKVRDQGNCGSCYTFSSAAAIETAYFLKYGKLLDVSEQQMVDCTYGSAGGCDGGWMSEVFEYIANNKNGLTTEDQYLYKGVSGRCKTSTGSVFLNKAKSYVQVANDDNSIKTALNDVGALAVCVDASGWSSYKSGIFSSSKYSRPSCTHAVALVGYGKDSSGTNYWIVRNSWADWWGEKGYIRLDATRSSKGKPYGGIMLDYAWYPVFA